MDYKKKYEEALERAKNTIEVNQAIPDIVECVESLFPELAKSEDERIRKELTEFLKSASGGFLDTTIQCKTFGKWATWLEKQKTSEEAMKYLKLHHSPSEVSDFQAAMNIAVAKAYDKGRHDTLEVIEEEKPLLEKFKQAVYDCAWGKVTCKKEGETKEEYANRWAEQLLLIARDWADDYIDFTIQQKLRNSYEKGKTDIIEKQDEQNPADKVEPKFKVGQTIKKKGFNLGFTIVKIEDGFYYNDMGDNFPFTDQDNWELIDNSSCSEDNEIKDNWEYIQEFIEKFGHFPKDCDELDVLINYVLSRKQKFTLSEEDNKIIEEIINDIECARAINYHAPKEGYKFRENWLKSLKDKVQPQPKQEWSEEDESRITTICTYLQDYARLSGSESRTIRINEYCDWLKSLKDKVQPQPKQEWSEEDEKMRKRAICACNFTIDRTMSEGHYQEARDWLKSLPIGFIKNPNYNEDMVELLVIELRQIENQNKAPKQYDKEIEWLKSLRPQNTWKPSDEQIASITCAVRKMKESACYDSELVSLFNDLKKLMEE